MTISCHRGRGPGLPRGRRPDGAPADQVRPACHSRRTRRPRANGKVRPRVCKTVLRTIGNADTMRSWRAPPYRRQPSSGRSIIGWPAIAGRCTCGRTQPKPIRADARRLSVQYQADRALPGIRDKLQSRQACLHAWPVGLSFFLHRPEAARGHRQMINWVGRISGRRATPKCRKDVDSISAALTGRTTA